jgi:predicted XRE-type DNA-binding protein
MSQSPQANGASHYAREPLIQALRDSMERGNLSQTATAKLLGTDQPTLSKLLSGSAANVSIARLGTRSQAGVTTVSTCGKVLLARFTARRLRWTLL